MDHMVFPHQRISTWVAVVEGARRKADYLHAVGFIGEGFQHGCFARAGMALNANNSVRADEYRLNRLILVGGEVSVSGIKICTDRLGLPLAVIHMGAMMLRSVSRVVRAALIIIILSADIIIL